MRDRSQQMSKAIVNDLKAQLPTSATLSGKANVVAVRIGRLQVEESNASGHDILEGRINELHTLLDNVATERASRSCKR